MRQRKKVAAAVYDLVVKPPKKAVAQPFQRPHATVGPEVPHPVVQVRPQPPLDAAMRLVVEAQLLAV